MFGAWQAWWKPNLVISYLGNKKSKLSKLPFPCLLNGTTASSHRIVGGCSGMKQSAWHDGTWTWNLWNWAEQRDVHFQSSTCVPLNVSPGGPIEGKAVKRSPKFGYNPCIVLHLFRDFFHKSLKCMYFTGEETNPEATQWINGRLGSQNRCSDSDPSTFTELALNRCLIVAGWMTKRIQGSDSWSVVPGQHPCHVLATC